MDLQLSLSSRTKRLRTLINELEELLKKEKSVATPPQLSDIKGTIAAAKKIATRAESEDIKKDVLILKISHKKAPTGSGRFTGRKVQVFAGKKGFWVTVGGRRVFITTDGSKTQTLTGETKKLDQLLTGEAKKQRGLLERMGPKTKVVLAVGAGILSMVLLKRAFRNSAALKVKNANILESVKRARAAVQPRARRRRLKTPRELLGDAARRLART